MLVLASIPSPPSNAIHLGDLQLRYYGMCIALGVFAAIWLADRRHVARGGNRDDWGYIGMWGALAGLVGARVYHVITDWRSFEGRWGDVFKVWEGGLGIPGGLVAGVLVGLWAAKQRGVAARDALDIAAPAIPLAQAIGRLGNWFNQELFGRPTKLPWAIEIDAKYRPLGYETYTTFQPTFLYELLWNLALCGVLLYLHNRRLVPRGKLFAVYVFGYSLGRLWVEALRIDKASHIFGARVNIWVALLGILGGLAWYVFGPEQEVAPVPVDGDAGHTVDDTVDDPTVVDSTDDMVDNMVDDTAGDTVDHTADD
jgi:prolipoprotein diacylglyceryl transferase